LPGVRQGCIPPPLGLTPLMWQRRDAEKRNRIDPILAEPTRRGGAIPAPALTSKAGDGEILARWVEIQLPGWYGEVSRYELLE